MLSIESQLWKELVSRNLATLADVEIVGETCNFIDCLAVISQRGVHVWIHSSESGPDWDMALSRAYDIAPELVIVRVNAQKECILQVQVNSVCEVLCFANQWKAGFESAYSH